MQTSAAGVKTYGTDYFPNEYAQGSINLTWDENTTYHGYARTKYVAADLGTYYAYNNQKKENDKYIYFKDAVYYKGKYYDAKVYVWSNMSWFTVLAQNDANHNVWYCHINNGSHGMVSDAEKGTLPDKLDTKIYIQIELQGLNSFQGITYFDDLDNNEGWSTDDIVDWYYHTNTQVNISGNKVLGTRANTSVDNIHLTVSSDSTVNFIYHPAGSAGGAISFSDTNVTYKVANNSEYRAGETLRKVAAPCYSYYDVLSQNDIEGLQSEVTEGNRTYRLKSEWYSDSNAKTVSPSSLTIKTSPYTIYGTYYKTWNLTTNIDHGTVTPSERAIEPGDDRTITWKPDAGYYVSSVKIDGTAQSNISEKGGSYTFSNITSDHTVDVVCKPFHKVTTKVTNGTISPSDSTIKDGASYTASYNPVSEEYYLQSVKVDGKEVSISSYSDTYGFSNITADHEIEVIYAKKPAITLTKTIAVDDIYFEHGNPSFIFKVNGTDRDGKKCTYYQSGQFDEDYVKNNAFTKDGVRYVSQTVKFENLMPGDYSASEVSVSRYDTDSVTDMTHGLSNGTSASFNLKNSDEGKAAFTNANTVYRNFSHNDMKINGIHK